MPTLSWPTRPSQALSFCWLSYPASIGAPHGGQSRCRMSEVPEDIVGGQTARAVVAPHEGHDSTLPQYAFMASKITSTRTLQGRTAFAGAALRVTAYKVEEDTCHAHTRFFHSAIACCCRESRYLVRSFDASWYGRREARLSPDQQGQGPLIPEHAVRQSWWEESSNGKQQGSGATRPNSRQAQAQSQLPTGERATETAAEWICSSPCEGGRQTPPPKPAPAPKTNTAITYAEAEAVKDTNSSKATEKKEKEAARESLKAEARSFGYGGFGGF